MLTEAEIRNALQRVKYPGYSRDIVSFGLVKQVTVNGGRLNVTLQLASIRPEVAQQIRADTERELKTLPGVESVEIEAKGTTAPAGSGGPDPWAK